MDKFAVEISNEAEYLEAMKTLLDMGYSWGDEPEMQRPDYIPESIRHYEYKFLIVAGWFGNNRLAVCPSNRTDCLEGRDCISISFEEFIKEEAEDLEEEEISIIELIS